MPNALRILIADDEEIVRYTLDMLLNHLGHRRHCVADGLSALKALEDGDYDVAIVDIRMPGLDGIGFLNRAKEIRPGMPVVIASGYASDETREDVLKAGASAFLPKPFRLKEIQVLLKKIFPAKEI